MERQAESGSPTTGPGAKTFFEEHEKATLLTLCKGLLPEMFQREFDQALANVLDPNTPFKKKREVILKVVLTTNDARDAIYVEGITQSKLAPFIGENGIVFAAKRGTQVVAVTYNPEQMQLPLEPPRVVRDPAPADAAATTTKARRAQA